MISIKQKYKKNTQNYIDKNVNNIFKNLNIISEINESEYVYLDKIDLQYINNQLLKNKIVITKKINNYYMFENNYLDNTKDMTKLDYKQIVDLIILNNTEKGLTKDIEELIDNDTIIIKNLGNNIIYIEDKKKEEKIIITGCEKIVIKGNGIYSQLHYYEQLN